MGGHYQPKVPRFMFGQLTYSLRKSPPQAMLGILATSLLMFQIVRAMDLFNILKSKGHGEYVDWTAPKMPRFYYPRIWKFGEK